MTKSTFSGLLVLLVGLCTQALGCSSGVTPDGNSFRWFYDSTAYGQLGVLGLSNNVHILNEYRCYDLSFLLSKELRIYFNNKVDEGADTSPKYIGALVVRLFNGRYSEGQFSAYLYRNSTDDSRTSSKWIHRRSNNTAAVADELVPRIEALELPNAFMPKQAIRASNLRELNIQIRLSSSQEVERLKDWHALVANSTEDGFLVHEDTRESDPAWVIESTIGNRVGEGQYLITRGYLIKYQNSGTPRAEPFFQIGAQQADCVYIKLIGSADFVTNLAIRKPGNGSDFIALKMKRNAICE